MAVRVILVFLAVLFSSCEERAGVGRVSLSSVISNPERFVDHDLAVVGYHKSGHEPPTLYISSQHALLDDWPSGVKLWETINGERFSALADCQDQYVMVIGRFALLPTEKRGITDIVRVVALGDGRGDSKICFNAAK